MKKEDEARIHKLELTLSQMESKAKSLNDDIEYIKEKIALSKIVAAK